MCAIDNGLWCWDATTQAASDDPPSQHRGWRGVLSFSFEVHACQGRVTLSCKSLRESVRLRQAPLFEVFVPNTLCLLYNLSSVSSATSQGQNHPCFLVHQWKTCLLLLDHSWARHLRTLSMKPFYLFLRVVHTFGWFPSLFILCTAFLFHKIPKLYHPFISASQLSRVANLLTLDDPFYLRL